jgi:hypothetical protein
VYLDQINQSDDSVQIEARSWGWPEVNHLWNPSLVNVERDRQKWRTSRRCHGRAAPRSTTERALLQRLRAAVSQREDGRGTATASRRGAQTGGAVPKPSLRSTCLPRVRRRLTPWSSRRRGGHRPGVVEIR